MFLDEHEINVPVLEEKTERTQAGEGGPGTRSKHSSRQCEPVHLLPSLFLLLSSHIMADRLHLRPQLFIHLEFVSLAVLLCNIKIVVSPSPDLARPHDSLGQHDVGQVLACELKASLWFLSPVWVATPVTGLMEDERPHEVSAESFWLQGSLPRPGILAASTVGGHRSLSKSH